MPQVITPFQKQVFASNAVLATAVSGYQTVLATAVTEAKAVTNVTAAQITIVPGGIIFDGTNYIVQGSVLYKTVVTT